jgi:predicted dinucleotide-binding enzyme
MKIGIIGAGNVGSTLGAKWAAIGHEVKFGLRDPDSPKTVELLAQIPTATVGTVAETADFGQVVVLATPWSGAQSAVESAGDLSGKVVLDLTNPINAEFTGLEVGLDTSAGEKVQEWALNARVVKIFNTVGNNVMADAEFNDEPASMFYCGDDPEAKQMAAGLASELGFDPIDVGPLEQARMLEPLAWLWITMALKYGFGREIAFNLVRRR